MGRVRNRFQPAAPSLDSDRFYQNFAQFMNPFKFLDRKSQVLVKIGVITIGTVYGGHKLVQFVSPTEEELLKVGIRKFILYLLLNQIIF